MRDELTQEDLRLYDLHLFQPRQGYRYSLDAILLARFCAELHPGGGIIDLGAGCGIISLILARINPTASVEAVENNPEMAALVERNIQHNDLVGRVSLCTEDVINLRKHYPHSTFDLVVSNPPFRTPGSGRISPRAGRDAARHETTAGLADFLAAAKYLVKPKGKICFIQHPSRLSEFISLAGNLKLSVLRLRIIHSNAESPATMFMAELAKGRRSAPVVESPLFVRDERENYSEEVAKILGSQHKKTSEVSKASEV
jgi:tRNA1Val (adenine37-N6)-methyltransferase